MNHSLVAVSEELKPVHKLVLYKSFSKWSNFYGKGVKIPDIILPLIVAI